MKQSTDFSWCLLNATKTINEKDSFMIMPFPHDAISTLVMLLESCMTVSQQ